MEYDLIYTHFIHIFWNAFTHNLGLFRIKIPKLFYLSVGLGNTESQSKSPNIVVWIERDDRFRLFGLAMETLALSSFPKILKK
ncbi:hypothetical protein BpHYR1_019304 [Brachionus plicatilis]|uniref:Uncharacterized protein n=1 Tax=Brachionus plicatilis TaxID=10195 RepID=A0A3M7RHD7_BRAPC|nr:hypothetical protein BpHYR1_019304 [Brachionus plicatilis]